MIHLTDQPIDSQQALRRIHSTQAGAVVMFLGTTREYTRGRKTVYLQYEGYTDMAERLLAELERQARARWPIIGCALLHRMGQVDLGEASVLVAVTTAHRKDAFEAASWLMDAIKRDVPIWKQEHWADGSCDWVHPKESDGPIDAPERPTQFSSPSREDSCQ